MQTFAQPAPRQPQQTQQTQPESASERLKRAQDFYRQTTTENIPVQAPTISTQAAYVCPDCKDPAGDFIEGSSFSSHVN